MECELYGSHVGMLRWFFLIVARFNCMKVESHSRLNVFYPKIVMLMVVLVFFL